MKRRQVVRQRRRRAPKTQLQPAHLANPPFDLSRQVYLSMAHAAQYLDLPSENALRMRVKAGVVPVWCFTRLGGSLRFIRSALDDLLQSKDRERTMATLRRVEGRAR